MNIEYSIKDLEQLSGIKAHTLRIWETRYNILRPSRTQTNIRIYSDKDLKRILNISLLNTNGLKISKISSLTDERISQEVEKIVHAYQQPSDQVEGLVMAMVEFDEEKFENIISKCLLHFGFEKTIEEIVFPFLRKTGVLWQIGVVTPAQEHFISHLVRQKLIVGIDAIPQRKSSNGKSFILYLPADELHELSLLYYNYMVRLTGNYSIYLGQSVPLGDLKKVFQNKKADFLVTVMTTAKKTSAFVKYLEDLHTEFPSTKILISGPMALQKKVSLHSNQELFASPAEFRKYL